MVQSSSCRSSLVIVDVVDMYQNKSEEEPVTYAKTAAKNCVYCTKDSEGEFQLPRQTKRRDMKQRQQQRRQQAKQQQQWITKRPQKR